MLETKALGWEGAPASSVAGGHAGGLIQRRRGEKTTKIVIAGSSWEEKLEIKVGVSMHSRCQSPGSKGEGHVWLPQRKRNKIPEILLSSARIQDSWREELKEGDSWIQTESQSLC